MFNGKIHYKWQFFNSYVKLPEGNHILFVWSEPFQEDGRTALLDRGGPGGFDESLGEKQSFDVEPLWWFNLDLTGFMMT